MAAAEYKNEMVAHKRRTKARQEENVLTIPKGTLFPMCVNLALRRELIGPAMYFGLMGDGQPIGRCEVCGLADA
ncbi:hypothetical protein PS1_025187 [Malus domestica]